MIEGEGNLLFFILYFLNLKKMRLLKTMSDGLLM
jgi:hypothetical protein